MLSLTIWLLVQRRQTESSSLQIGDDGLVRQIGRDDLRLKLMRKVLSQKINGDSEQNGVDLREKLSRKSKNRQGHEARGRDPESRSIYDVREVPESGSRYGSRGRVQGSRACTLVSPSARCADDLFKLESSGKPYPSWTADGSMHRSPEKLPSVRRDMTPPRSVRRGMSPQEVFEEASLLSQGVIEEASLLPQEVSGEACLPHELMIRRGKSNIMLDTVQPANGISSSGTRVHIAPVLEEVPLTVTGLLNSMGLEKYVVLFQGEEVDMTALSQMKDSDLKDMGVPMGPRKKILQAAVPYAKQWQRCPMI
uniref:Uncharacterized protein n=1 Tax=Avena sativa TaxID=4498 RepID=A0ACD5Z5C7_AVESA